MSEQLLQAASDAYDLLHKLVKPGVPDSDYHIVTALAAAIEESAAHHAAPVTPQQEASGEPFVHAVSELLGHISDVLPDEAFDLIDTGKWNAVSGWIGTSRAAATAPAGGVTGGKE